MKYFDKILNSQKTIFNYDDISLLLWISNDNTIKSFFARWIREWLFINIYKWIYALKNFNIYELSNKIKKNSYISFESVLKKEWIIFQDYANIIFLASDNTISKKINNNTFQYHKIKNSILLNPLGIINKSSYMIASKERAICDRVYISGDYYFDNLDNINFDLLQSISQIYNRRVVLAIQKIIKNAK